jgi:hypothetical protein
MITAEDFAGAVILESDMFSAAKGSYWKDTMTSYPFPSNYLGVLEGLSVEHPTLTIIYEPRGRQSKGRISYVAWTILRNPPVPDGDAWALPFSLEPFEFQITVPREIDGIPLESWLANIQRGRSRNVATQGRAIRRIPIDEALRILSLGAPELDVAQSTGLNGPNKQASDPERRRRVTSTLERDAEFRRKVVAGYSGRCAVTGLEDGSGRVVEAAHIRPAGAGHRGSDKLDNGICLSPTVHRLFDLGLIGLEFQGEELVLLISKRADPSHLKSDETGADLGLVKGRSVRLPGSVSSRPNLDNVDYHRQKIFLD